MFVYITNADGSMFVHELCGVVSVTWVSKLNKSKACKFPAAKAAEWASVVADISGVECVASQPMRPGML